MVRRRHEDALVPLLVHDAAPALQVRPQRPLPLAVDGNLRLHDPPVLVRVLVRGDAGERVLDFLLEGQRGGFVLHVGCVVELCVLALEGRATEQLQVLVGHDLQFAHGCVSSQSACTEWERRREEGEVAEGS